MASICRHFAGATAPRTARNALGSRHGPGSRTRFGAKNQNFQTFRARRRAALERRGGTTAARGVGVRVFAGPGGRLHAAACHLHVISASPVQPLPFLPALVVFCVRPFLSSLCFRVGCLCGGGRPRAAAGGNRVLAAPPDRVLAGRACLPAAAARAPGCAAVGRGCATGVTWAKVEKKEKAEETEIKMSNEQCIYSCLYLRCFGLSCVWGFLLSLLDAKINLEQRQPIIHFEFSAAESKLVLDWRACHPISFSLFLSFFILFFSLSLFLFHALFFSLPSRLHRQSDVLATSSLICFPLVSPPPQLSLPLPLLFLLSFFRSFFLSFFFFFFFC